MLSRRQMTSLLDFDMFGILQFFLNVANAGFLGLGIVNKKIEKQVNKRDGHAG